MKQPAIAAFITVLLVVATLAPAARSQAAALGDPREGSPFGVCIHKALQDEGPVADALDDLGAPWVRIDVNWNELEPSQGVFDFSAMDRMVDTARAHGLLVFATLAYTPQWATNGTVRNGVPTSADHYANFVRAVVARYSDRVQHWGLWNEPEQPRFWAGTAQQFVDLVLVPGAAAVHETDPDALALGPDSGSDDWLDDIFASGGGDVLDVITVHVYACCDSSDDVDKVLWRLDCTGGWPWETCRRRVIEDHGLQDKPVWLTEVGWKTLTPEWESRQAALYVELLDAMSARPWWKKTIFYELWDEAPCDPGVDNCWGIVRPDGTRKPAFDALADYIAAHPLAMDGGVPAPDAGTPAADGGTNAVDGGALPRDDAGAAPLLDAGAVADAGQPPIDGGTSLPDDGAEEATDDVGPARDCSCGQGSAPGRSPIAVVLAFAALFLPAAGRRVARPRTALGRVSTGTRPRRSTL